MPESRTDLLVVAAALAVALRDIALAVNRLADKIDPEENQ